MIRTVAAGWGRFLGFYGRRIVNRHSVRFVAEPNLPPSPLILVCWHEHNLIAIALYRLLRAGPAFALVPKGAKGDAMTTWVRAAGMMPLPVPGDARDGIQLRRMVDALHGGGDVLIAVDGPTGPRRRIRPGALWLAEAADVPVVAFGCTARPAFRFPRWDRHLVPLPGARITAAVSEPMSVARNGRSAAEAWLAAALDEVGVRAARELGSAVVSDAGAALQPGSAPPWK